MSFFDKITCMKQVASDPNLTQVLEPHSDKESEAILNIEEENIRSLVMSGMSLSRISEIIGDSKLVHKFTKSFIKKGGSNDNQLNLEEKEMDIA